MTSASDANRELIRDFYEALGRRDGERMAEAYASGARFRDPAFGELTGEQAGEMWRMLTRQAQDLEVELLEHAADEERGSARWIARYTFTPTGRRVVNDVRTSFRFREGRIAEHEDRFSFYRWARQALGPAGVVLGWTPVLRGVFRGRARAGLTRFSAQAEGLKESANPVENTPPRS